MYVCVYIYIYIYIVHVIISMYEQLVILFLLGPTAPLGTSGLLLACFSKLRCPFATDGIKCSIWLTQ